MFPGTSGRGDREGLMEIRETICASPRIVHPRPVFVIHTTNSTCFKRKCEIYRYYFNRLCVSTESEIRTIQWRLEYRKVQPQIDLN